jgi:uncharacterized protein with GYD domain
MAFIVLIKLRNPDAKELVTTLDALRKEEEQRGIKFLGIYLTRGQYDAVAALETPRIEDAFKGPSAMREILTTNVLVWVATVKHSD